MDGDVTKAKQRLTEFKHPLKDREHCYKNPRGAGRDAGKLNRDLDSSAVFGPTKMANIDFEDQTLPGRGNTMTKKNETAEELHGTYECCAAYHYEHKWWNRELKLKVLI